MRALRWTGWLGLVLALGSTQAAAGVWPTDIDRVARQLEASEVAERRAAAGRLTQLPAAVAGSLVTRAIDDPDAEVRLAAVAALLEHRLPPPEERLLGWLSEQDARLRLAACQGLRAGVSGNGVGAMARALGDADARVRQAAAVSLGNSEQGDGVVALLGHLDDPLIEVRTAVVDGLWKLGDARAVVPLAGKVQDSAPEVRRAVARALGELGDRRATNALILALRDPATDVRVEALSALGQLADPSAVAALTPMIDPAQPIEVRRAALDALGRTGGARALEILVRALERDEAARAPARDALVAAGDAAVPALLAVLQAPPSERAAAGAAEALGRLRAPSRDALVAALRRGVLPVPAALRALRALGDPAAVPVVLELVADRSASVRAEARATLEVLLDGRTPQGAAIDPLAAALNDARLPAAERPALVRLLGRTRSPRAAALVTPLVKVPALRLAAIDALGSLGDASNPAPLVAALDEDDAAVRAHAGAALARTASDATTTALLERLAGAQQQDRAALSTALAGALGRSPPPAAVERAVGLLPLLEGAPRDALLEGLGRSGAPAALAALQRRLPGAEAADRRKIAESLAGHPSALDPLRSLLADPDASVRAAAAWALAASAPSSDLPALGKLLADPVASVAANAAQSLGRVALRAGAADEARKALCPALRDPRPVVRAGALAGLAQARARCDRDGAPERLVLSLDPAPLARAAAADLLRVASPSERDRRALSRCHREDPYGSVALRCAPLPRAASSAPTASPAASAPAPGAPGAASAAPAPGAAPPAAPPAAPAAEEPVTVLVIPDGRSQPAPELPFALRLADGRLRHGLTDRRGVVFESHAPAGPVSLEVAAPFVR